LRSNSAEDVRFHLSRESKRKIYSATITAVIVVLTTGQAHAGFLLILLVLPLSIWLGWSAFVIVRRPYARLAQFICILIWAIAILLLVAAQYLRHEITRRDANTIVETIDHFRTNNGYCAPTLEGMGLKSIEVEDKVGANFSYACTGRRPKFSYVATFTIIDTFDYDFDKDRWKYTSWAEKKKFLETSPPAIGVELANPSMPLQPPGSRPMPRRTP
jgi:hypothetical protein